MDQGDESSPQVRDVVASFQKAVVDVLIDRTVRACRREEVSRILVSGGVACNNRLRRAFAERGEREGLAVYFPSPIYSTDNAAMIAAAGFLHFERKQFAGIDASAQASLAL